MHFPNLCGPVNWDCRIHWLHLCRRVRILKRVSWYDTKRSNGVASEMLELRGTQSILLLLSLPSPLLPCVVEPDRILSTVQIELYRDFESLLFLSLNCVFMLNWIARNRTIWYVSYVLMPNWIIFLDRTVFWHWNYTTLNWIVREQKLHLF